MTRFTITCYVFNFLIMFEVKQGYGIIASTATTSMFTRPEIMIKFHQSKMNDQKFLCIKIFKEVNWVSQAEIKGGELKYLLASAVLFPATLPFGAAVNYQCSNVSNQQKLKKILPIDRKNTITQTCEATSIPISSSTWGRNIYKKYVIIYYSKNHLAIISTNMLDLKNHPSTVLQTLK